MPRTSCPLKTLPLHRYPYKPTQKKDLYHIQYHQAILQFDIVTN